MRSAFIHALFVCVMTSAAFSGHDSSEIDNVIDRLEEKVFPVLTNLNTNIDSLHNEVNWNSLELVKLNYDLRGIRIDTISE